jgi:hypothetical protein
MLGRHPPFGDYDLGGNEFIRRRMRVREATGKRREFRRVEGEAGLRLVAASSKPRLTLEGGRALVDLSDCDNRCGSGGWCEACRVDIRTEALLWLRELAVSQPSVPATYLSWGRAWSEHVLLADQ